MLPASDLFARLTDRLRSSILRARASWSLSGSACRRRRSRLLAWARRAPERRLARRWRALLARLEPTADDRSELAARAGADLLLSRFSGKGRFTGSSDEAAFFASAAARRLSPAALRRALNGWSDERIGKLTVAELAPFVRRLPQTLPFFPNWPWRVANRLLDRQLDPLEFGFEPSVDLLAVLPPPIRARWWRHLERTGRIDQLLDLIDRLPGGAHDPFTAAAIAGARARRGAIDEAFTIAERRIADWGAEAVRPIVQSLLLALLDDPSADSAETSDETIARFVALRGKTGGELPIPALRQRIGNEPSRRTAESLLRTIERLVAAGEKDAGLILFGLGLVRFAGRPSSVLGSLGERALERRLDERTASPGDIDAVLQEFVSHRTLDELGAWLDRVAARPAGLRYPPELLSRLADRDPLRAMLTAIDALEAQRRAGRFDTATGRATSDLYRRLRSDATGDPNRIDAQLDELRGRAPMLLWLRVLDDRRRLPAEDVSLRAASFANWIAAAIDWRSRESPIIDFSVRVARQVLDNGQFRAAFATVPRAKLPYFARILLAQSDLAAGDHEATRESLAELRRKHPNDPATLLAEARLMRATHRNGTALERCRRVLEIDPNHQAARVEILSIRRTVERNPRELLGLIDNWTAGCDDPIDRARRRIPLLWSIGDSRRAVAEGLDWYRAEGAEEAARHLARSLFLAGEGAAAETIYGRVGPASLRGAEAVWIERIERLRRLFPGTPLDETEALSIAEEIARSVRPEAIDTEFAPVIDALERRMRVPDVLVARALAISPPIAIDDFARHRGPIALVTASLGHGGAERQVAYTAIGLSDCDEIDREVVLVCPNLVGHNADFFLADVERHGVQVVSPTADSGSTLSDEIRAETDPHRRSVLELLEAWPPRHGRERIITYFRTFERLRPSVAHTWQDKTNVHAGIAAVLAGVPRIVMSGRSLSPLRFPMDFESDRELYRMLLGRSEVVLTNNSRAGADDYARWLDVSPDSIPVILNGFDFDRIDSHCAAADSAELRRRLDVPEGALLIGAVGRMDEVKRPRLCLETMRRLLEARPDAYAVMIGGGPMQQEIAELAAATPQASRFRFPGVLSPVEPWMKLLDLMLLTSRVEGLPNVLVEAQSVGTPVASTDVGGASETFVDGVTGVLLRDERPEAMAAAILEFLGRVEPAATRRVASEHARATFGMRRMIDRTRKILLPPDAATGSPSEADSPVACRLIDAP